MAVTIADCGLASACASRVARISTGSALLSVAVSYSVKSKELLELPVLILKGILFLDRASVDFLELHDLLLQRFDVPFLPFAVGSGESIRYGSLQEGGKPHKYLWACLFSSWRRVKAGLVSGLGPLLFGGWPSVPESMTNHEDRGLGIADTSIGLFVTTESFEKAQAEI